MNILKWFFAIVDVAFIAYWICTGFHLLPPQYVYRDYLNPILVAWNWSFLPLDTAIVFTGICATILHTKSDSRWAVAAIISLSLTFSSGLQALAFWTCYKDFDALWWAPNMFLVFYPAFFLWCVFSKKDLRWLK